MNSIPSAIFLAAAVASVMIGTAGLALVRGAAARLHFLSFTSLVAPVLLMAAVLADQGLSQAGVKAILIAGVLVLQGPAVAHALGRAIYSHERRPPAHRRGHE